MRGTFFKREVPFFIFKMLVVQKKVYLYATIYSFATQQ